MTSKDVLSRLREEAKYIDDHPPGSQFVYCGDDGHLFGQAADEIERLQRELKIQDDANDILVRLIHDAGAAFTGGHEHCSTCRRVYNSLATSQRWTQMPAEKTSP